MSGHIYDRGAPHFCLTHQRSMRECEEADRRTIEILPRLEAMKVLTVREDDVLIVRTEQMLSGSTHDRIIEMIRDALPERVRDKVSIVILMAGLDIGVLRTEEKK